ncbi:MAG: hypothetical protein ACOZF0_03375 [Thermodesulfobacteriota bacterium]
MENTNTESQAPSEPEDLGMTVAQYFLTIFRLHLKASPYAQTECRLLGAAGAKNNRRTYELRIQQEEEWKTRRMTIMPLGEGSGSKSKCFYVIYDDHLVVKIPPVPITDFSKYIGFIQVEQRIAVRLAPRVCITPSVSVIMQHAFPLPEDENETLSPEESEAAYVKWLADNPDAQSHLKINGGFVFFMDLARYFILADVLDSLRGRTRDSMEDEITKNSGVLFDIHNFEGRYGHGTGRIGEALAAVYSEYEKRLRNLLEGARITVSKIQYKFQEWFSAHLAGAVIDETKEQSVSVDIIPAMNRLIKTVLEENGEAVGAYRELIRRFLMKKSFSQSRTQISSIINNIMDLLAYLGRKRVAMRDFKPDNVLVAGDPGRYPNFLSSPDAFFLGLIDVETAIIIDPQKDTPLPQPRLGGTPLFSTPSQLVTNELLAQAFGDVSRIFFLQDWYAAMVMMYKVVTDENLFVQTAKTLPGIIRTIQKAAREKRFTIEVVEAVSASFWKSAVAEYRQHVAQREKMLRAVETVVPRTANALMMEIFQEEKERSETRIRNRIAVQTYYKTEKNQEQLWKASAQQVESLLLNMTESDPKTEEQHTTESRRCFLTALLAEKSHIARCQDYIERFRNNEPIRFDGFELLNIFFNCVYRRMYPESWGAVHAGPLLDLPAPIAANQSH